jgi:hypothetical protein
MAMNRRAASGRRRNARLQYWPHERAWTGENAKGWFKAPRTLPLLLGLMASKTVSENQDPTRVYLELLARHVDEGVIQMATEDDHAYAAGYDGPRGVRTWRERMRLLETNGFIKIKSIGNKRYGYVLIVHPEVVIDELRRAGRVPEKWSEAYRERQSETGEVSFEEMAVETMPEPGRREITFEEDEVAVAVLPAPRRAASRR